MAGRNDDLFRCSFCGKTQDQVHKLIAGPNGAYICDECVDVCSEIIDDLDFLVQSKFQGQFVKGVLCLLFPTSDFAVILVMDESFFFPCYQLSFL